MFRLALTLTSLMASAYVYRAVRAFFVQRWVRGLSLAVLLGINLSVLMRNALTDALELPLRSSVVVGLYAWLGFGIFLSLAFMALDGVRLVLWLARRKSAPVDQARRQLMQQMVAGTAVVVGTGTSVYGRYRAFAAPVVTELSLRVPRLPRTLDGLTLVQLTDVHIGHAVRREFIEEWVRRTNALRPDVIAITGDLVDRGEEVADHAHALGALGALKSRFGRFFVTGNHDMSGAEEVCARLASMGIESLRNRRKAVGDGGGLFDVVGVEDWSARRLGPGFGYDLEQALAGRDDSRAAVLLAHQPANFEEVARRGVDLQLSGHTHGGQMFPMTELIKVIWANSAGLYSIGPAHLYVSRGCGFWGPPMRVGSPPELVKIVLTT